MAETRNVTQAIGLPRRVDASDGAAVERTLARIIEVLKTWNGEIGNPGDRMVTKDELDRALK
jgi:hypothetical protein